ncbi:MAG: hypothetical protein HY927_12235 [Elusimicrobia bacterium]|nr:hypothetical protein [Elusimicrobiota bacterium]
MKSPRGLVLGATLMLTCAQAGAFLGFGGAGPTGLLWVPPESFAEWGEVAAALARHKKLSFTAALTPAMATPRARQVLAPFIDDKRLEIALRVPGDPILPLIHAHPAAPRPQDAVELLAEAREEHKSLWGTPPRGFAPGAGAMDPRLFPVLRSMDLAWVAVGSDPAGRGWSHYKGMLVVPCRAVRTLGREPTARDLEPARGGQQAAAPAVLVLDEADALVPEGAWLRLLAGPDAKRVAKTFQPVSRALDGVEGTQVKTAAPSWSDWTGEDGFWSRRPEQQLAWRLYGDAARAIAESGSAGAGPGAIAGATAALREAQANRFYRLNRIPAQGSQGQAAMEEADRQFRRHLVSVYKSLRQPAPDSVLASLLTPARPGRRAGASSDEVQARAGPNWLSFDNPVPRGGPSPLKPLWRIERFRADWDDDAVILTYRMGGLAASTAAPHGFDRLVLDTYIDLNQVVGAGSTRLLEGAATASVEPRDAWEVAVSATGWGYALHRANRRGEPVIDDRGPLQADRARGEMRVRIPRSKLKGNPARWGFVVTAGEPTQEGAVLRGLLGSPVLQRRLSSAAPDADGSSALPGKVLRLPALRAPHGL